MLDAILWSGLKWLRIGTRNDIWALKKGSVSIIAQAILVLNHEFLSHVFQEKVTIVIDICSSYLKGK
jgi:hypothetical protein